MCIGCGAFTILGLMMIFSGEEIFAGLLAVSFFSGGGLYAIPKMLQRKVTLVLTPAGIEFHYIQGTTFVPWTDVEKIGIVSVFSNKMVGIRLNSYDRFLNEMSPQLAEFITKRLPYLKLILRATSLLDVPLVITLWSRLEGIDAMGSLRSFGKVGNLAEALLWARKHFGYDLTLAWAELDRPARKFGDMLEECRCSCGATTG